MITPVITAADISIEKDSLGWQCTVYELEQGADDIVWAEEHFAGVETKAEALAAARYAKNFYLDNHKDVVVTWMEEFVNKPTVTKKFRNK